jgi:3-oxoacyl-[acyl-carrier protein] reductase
MGVPRGQPRVLMAMVAACALLRPAAARTVLVTGASKGIGAAISSKFAAHGDRVVVHWRSDEAGAEAVRAQLAPSPEGGHVCVRADLSQPGSAAALVEQVIREVGSIDVLVCNHAVHEETPIESTTAEEWAASFDRVMRTNLHGPAELVESPTCLRG